MHPEHPNSGCSQHHQVINTRNGTPLAEVEGCAVPPQPPDRDPDAPSGLGADQLSGKKRFHLTEQQLELRKRAKQDRISPRNATRAFPDVYNHHFVMSEMKEAAQDDLSRSTKRVIVVDGIDAYVKDLRRHITNTAGHLVEGVNIEKCITKMSKSGFRIKMKRPEDVVSWTQAIAAYPNVNAAKLRVRAPKWVLEQNCKSVIALGVDPTITDTDLTANLNPKPEVAKRLMKNGKPTSAVKLIYRSQSFAKRLAHAGWVVFDEHIYFRCELPKRKRGLHYCRTCKKSVLSCKDKSCKELRCGRCGEHHRTKECHLEEKEAKCLECGSEEHLMFNCPIMMNRFESHEARRQSRKDKKKAGKHKKPANKYSQQQPKRDDPQSGAPAADKNYTIKKKTRRGPRKSGAAQADDTVPNDQHVFDADLKRCVVESYVEVCFPDLEEVYVKKIVEKTLKKLSKMEKGNSDETIVIEEHEDDEVKCMTDNNEDQQDMNVDAEYADPNVPTGSGPVDPEPNMDMDESMASLAGGQFASSKNTANENTSTRSTRSKPTKKKKRSKTPKKATKAAPSDTKYYNMRVSKFEDANLKIPSNATITCGCGRAFQPKGFGSHKRSCRSSANAVVNN